MTASDLIATYALAVAIVALGFTIGSFWWLNARPGKLEIIGEPRSFGFGAATELMLTLPLVFSNSRPLPAVAINIRLQLEASGFPQVVPFVATVDGILPSPGSPRHMATSIVIQGRETRLICGQFISGPFEVKLSGPTEVPATVEAYVLRGWWKWRRQSWRALLTFPLRLPELTAEQRNHYIAVDNQSPIGPG